MRSRFVRRILHLSSKKHCLKKIIFLCLAAVSFSCLPASAEEFLPLSDVHEGMTGYARTVVNGSAIDTFNVEVLGIMKNQGAAGDLILVRVSGPVIDASGGIAQGMSGSPVYIDGKLVGAISYGFPQSDGRTGMVTPIADMLKLWDDDNTKVPSLIPKPSRDLLPIETPLMATGYTSDALSYLSGKLKSFHLVPYAASGAGNDSTPSALEPGGAVAATLVTGDLKLGAIGTVTYVDGNHMIAFGHPFLDTGSSDYFMHNSYIFTVVPSREAPFKLGSIGAEIGAVTEDRGAGISGLSGVTAEDVPLHVTVTDEDTGTVKNGNVRMIDDESLLPTLTATSIYNFVSRTMNRGGEGTVSLSYTLWPEDVSQKPFTRQNMYWSDTGIAERSVDEIYNVTEALEQNRFLPYKLRSITVDAELTKDRKTAQLLDATATPAVVSPGDRIYIRVRLQPYRGEIFTKEMIFTVPKDQALGDMYLELRGGGVTPLPYLIQQQQYNLTDEIIDRMLTYKDFEDLRSTLEKTDQNNQVVAEILDPNVSMVMKSENAKKRAHLRDKTTQKNPDYLRAGGKDGGIQKKEDVPKSAVDTDYVINGDGQILFQVMTPEKRDQALLRMQQNRNREKSVTAQMQNQEGELIADKTGKGSGPSEKRTPSGE